MNQTNSSAASATTPCSPRWRFSLTTQKPHIGSRWYRGNFSLGVLVDSHPRFVNVVFAFVVIEVVVSWAKENDKDLARRALDSE